MKRPVESEYTSQVAYTRALEAYCDSLAQPEQEPVARVAEVHMSRYTLEWTNGPLPEGTELFAAAQPPLPVQETFGYWFADTDLEALSQGWFVKGPSDGKLNGVAGIALYTTPPQPDQEPVAWMTPDGEGFRIRFSPPVNDVPLGWDALYTAPPLPVQPDQEPFGHWHWEQPMTKPLQGWFVKGPSDGKLNGVAGIALYTTPPLPEQEPWMYRLWNDKDAQWQLTDDCSWPAEPIYTTPPQRPWGKPWVSLTYEEISVLSKGHMTRNGFARNVLAKSKENT